MTGRSRHRGSAYVMVLVCAMIIVVIGLSGMTIARLRHRAVVSTADMLEARALAISALDLGLFRIDGDPGWRSTHTNDAWTADQPLGPGAIAYKLVDESDQDLFAGPAGAVRLHGRGKIGGTVQRSSVMLARATSNLLTNADMENGTSGWTAPLAVLASDAIEVHGGNASLHVSSRLDSTAGPVQDVTAAMADKTTYATSVWVYVAAPDVLDVRLRVVNDGAAERLFSVRQRVDAGIWTKIEGVFGVSWSGTLASAEWKVETAAGTQDFRIDDARLTPLDFAMTPLSGTWRQEVGP